MLTPLQVHRYMLDDDKASALDDGVRHLLGKTNEELKIKSAVASEGVGSEKRNKKSAKQLKAKGSKGLGKSLFD